MLFFFVDIEEITHKAGNFKKFPVFVKMLSSSFSKDSETVFVDLLTYSDLEMLKAKKTGAVGVSAQHSSSGTKQQLKRYIILTYTAEFDRVHYPLPLSFEDEPNVGSMERTIRRLRAELKAEKTLKQEPNNEKERYYFQ